MITPIQQTDEEFVRKWSEVKYKGKTFWEDIPELYTEEGNECAQNPRDYCRFVE